MFGRIIPEVVGYLDGLGVRRGMMVGWYADDMARNVTELQMPVRGTPPRRLPEMSAERNDVASAGSPRVISHAWGHIEVDGVGSLRDAKLWPGGGREWDWNETGTRHRPGIQPGDVRELLAYDPDVVVLSRGRQLRLETCPDTVEVLEGHGVRIVLDETESAIAAYNHLAATGERVAGLFHTTC